MTAPTNLTFIDKVTTVPTRWLQGVNDVVNGIEPHTLGPNSSVDTSITIFDPATTNLWTIGAKNIDVVGSSDFAITDVQTNVDVLFYDQSAGAWDFKAKAITNAGAVDCTSFTASGNATVGGTLDVTNAATFGDSVTITGDPGTTLQTINRTGTGTVEQKFQNNDNSLFFGMDGSNENFVMATASGLASGVMATFPRTGGINFGQSDLDYYEEGTWTPGLDDGTYSLSVAGRYKRVGSIVLALFDINCSGTTVAGSGSIGITGAPYASGFTLNNLGILARANGFTASGGDYLCLEASASSAVFSIRKVRIDGVTAAAADYSELSASFRLVGGILYEV